MCHEEFGTGIEQVDNKQVLLAFEELFVSDLYFELV